MNRDKAEEALSILDEIPHYVGTRGIHGRHYFNVLFSKYSKETCPVCKLRKLFND